LVPILLLSGKSHAWFVIQLVFNGSNQTKTTSTVKTEPDFLKTSEKHECIPGFNQKNKKTVVNKKQKLNH
jgi:hypothetical protein